MKTITNHIRDKTFNRLKIPIDIKIKNSKHSIDNLKKSEWSEEFETLMRNRLIMGAIRYGKLGASNKPQYDRISSMILRLKNYQETRNTEFLVDVANLCLCEFVEGIHPNKHFNAIDDGEHVKKIK